MKLGISVILPVVILAIAGSGICQENESGKKPDILAGTIEGLSVDNILTDQLELVEGVEVVVSHIVMPPNTELPKHWHHGEEFAYLIDGSVILWQEGKEEILFKKGDAAKIPLKQVHTARTTESSATILVFRVHESGQPVRVLVK
jgi:quercetin dioxygenase-like cupin family protein